VSRRDGKLFLMDRRTSFYHYDGNGALPDGPVFGTGRLIASCKALTTL
jgi:hypothetical protein